MALFTEADRDAIKAAYLTAMVEGIASASIGGQTVTGWNADQWLKALNSIQQDLANENALGGMRIRKTIPPAAG
jgi:hypothetical protein